MGIEEVVKVTITRVPVGTTRAGFGTQLVFGAHTMWTERTRSYSSVSSAEGDFNDPDDPVLMAVKAAFLQEPRPTSVKVGRQQVNTLNVAVVQVLNATTYAYKINSTTFSYLSDASATDDEITAGLVAAINLGSEPVTAVDNADGTFTLTADVPGTAFVAKPINISLLQNVYVAAIGRGAVVLGLTPAETVSAGLAAVEAYDRDWYTLVAVSATNADVLLAAAFIETRRKTYIVATRDANVKDLAPLSDTTSIAAQLKALGYARTMPLFRLLNEQFSDAGWAGVLLPYDPGEADAAHKTIKGSTADVLTDNEVANIEGKNCNWYRQLGSKSVTGGTNGGGVVSDGEFFDIVRDADWLQARIEERVFDLRTSVPKLPYTDDGVGMVDVQVRAQVQDAQDAGFLARDPAPTFTVPLVADADPANRSVRKFVGYKFAATVQGAINDLEIDGSVEA